MNKKKDEHDALAARHAHDLWTEDLDALLVALEKQEAIDEKDRQAHKSLGSTGKKAGRAKKPKAAAAKANPGSPTAINKPVPKAKKAATAKATGGNSSRSNAS